MTLKFIKVNFCERFSLGIFKNHINLQYIKKKKK